MPEFKVPSHLLPDAWKVSTEVDDIIEACQEERIGLEDTFDRLAPYLCETLGVDGIALKGLDEEFKDRLFCYGLCLKLDQKTVAKWGKSKSPVVYDLPDGVAWVRPLDTAGMNVATLIAAGASRPDDGEMERIQLLLHVASEELDNYVAAIQTSALKQRLVENIQANLRHKVLAQALDQAVATFADELSAKRMAILYFDDPTDRASLHYRVYDDGVCITSSLGDPKDEIEALAKDLSLPIEDLGQAILEKAFGPARVVRSSMVSGVTHLETLGMVFLGTERQSMDAFTVDILKLFAGCLSQRLVDYNREERYLSRFFSNSDTRRLLQHSSYDQRFLTPRAETAAVVFADISSFTAISEQILQTPERIGGFVDEWAHRAVDAIYRHGGVFDKLVGDCVIGLFGPPFFESTLEERALAALQAAWEINRVTAAFAYEDVIEKLDTMRIQPGMSVSTGINLSPMLVGTFGPNADYTAFAKGMNNAARLQGVAGFREILIMASVQEALPASEGHPFLSTIEIGPATHARVKNVAEPITYHSILYDPKKDEGLQ